MARLTPEQRLIERMPFELRQFAEHFRNCRPDRANETAFVAWEDCITTALDFMQIQLAEERRAFWLVARG